MEIFNFFRRKMKGAAKAENNKTKIVEKPPTCVTCKYMKVMARKRLYCKHPARRYSVVTMERTNKGSCKEQGFNFENRQTSSST